MTTDRLRVESNERIDIEDFRFVAGEGINANLRQLGHKFLIEESVTKSQDRTGYILSGFAMSNPSAKQLKVTKGKAILSQLLDGTVVQGIVTTEGAASITIDMNTYASATYGIYIRFQEDAGNTQSRIFWDPTGVGSENINSIATRHLASWAVRIETSSPGAEWLKIGEVVQSTMAITDQRPFYFEGSVDSTYDSGWSSDGDGGANDRNADRSTYGVEDLHTFIRAMKQCVEDIKGRGLKRWWDRDVGGMNIGFDANPVSGRLAIGDDAYYLELASSNPTIWFDSATSADYMEFTRSTNTLNFTINGSIRHSWAEDVYTTKEIISTGVTGIGIQSTGGANQTGIKGIGGSGGGAGIEGVGTGSERGGFFTGGSSNGGGVKGVGGATDGTGVSGAGTGSGFGGHFTGGATGKGLQANSGASGAYGMQGNAATGSNGIGVWGDGDGTGVGGHFVGGSDGAAIKLFERTGDPSSPDDGDVWITTAGLMKFKANGTVYTVDTV
jgi:hypothetical protein